MYTYFAARSASDLSDILVLQQANLATQLSRETALSEGFLTVEHDLALLADLNHPHGHTMARANDGTLAGYALVMERHFGNRIPILLPFFALLDELPYRGQPLGQWRYVVMGQVCVAQPHRGRGVFAGLYQDLQVRLRPHFELIVTEISLRNTRSLRAHAKVGFTTLHEYQSPDGEAWRVVALTTTPVAQP